MKPNLVADEMFPEGAGPFMELDEVFLIIKIYFNRCSFMAIYLEYYSSNGKTVWRIFWLTDGLGC